MATEREHIDRAEELAREADRHWRNANDCDIDEETRQFARQFAAAAAQMAAARAQLACARALTAEPPGPLRPARTTRSTRTASGFPDLPVTRMKERT